MDEAAIRKRCEAWAAEQGLMGYDFVGNGGWGHTDALVELIKSAYADGQRDAYQRSAAYYAQWINGHEFVEEPRFEDWLSRQAAGEGK